MIPYLYYALLGIYTIALLAYLIYYLSRKAPTGDASVGWALGVFYMAGLAGILVIALFLREKPAIGLVVLSFPLVFLALPRLRYYRTEWYTRFPSFADTPPLKLFIQNNTRSALRVKLECWFPTSKPHGAVLYNHFDYFLEPLERKNWQLDARQTRLLAHKSKYVSILIYEQVMEEYEGHRYLKEIQPCMECYDEKIEAFRSGTYKIEINPKGG